MKTKGKKLPVFTYFLMFYLQWWKEVNLAYHQDLQGMAHLAIIRHDPAKKQQVGAFLYPGETYDLYDRCPDIDEGWFTIIDTDFLWKKVNFKTTLGFDFGTFFAVHKAIKRLDNYKR